MVGPHEHRAAALSRPDRVTFHGWLNPEQLRDVYGRCHVFVNPGRGEPDGLGGEMIDGFPTLTAVSSIATGCLLVTTNPRSEPSFFTPGRTHIELQDASPEYAAALVRVRDDRHAAATIAAEGQRVVREKLDVFQWTRPLERIGLLEPSKRERWIDEPARAETRLELELIARRRPLRVPERGVVVEIGSFAGRSSVHWAANSDPSVPDLLHGPVRRGLRRVLARASSQASASAVPGQPSGVLFARSYWRQWADRLVLDRAGLAAPPPGHPRRRDLRRRRSHRRRGRPSPSSGRLAEAGWADVWDTTGRLRACDKPWVDFAGRRGLAACCYEGTYRSSVLRALLNWACAGSTSVTGSSR